MASEKNGPVMQASVPNELARQLGVLRLTKIIRQKQPISLNLLGAIFAKQAELEERNAVGSSLTEIMHTMQMFSKMFTIQRGSFGSQQEICVCLTNHANGDSLLLLGGVLKLKNILKQKGRLKIKQLSTFFNQQSSTEERKVIGRNPFALTQTIQALPSIFSISGHFVSLLTVEKTESDSSDEVNSTCHENRDCEWQMESQTCSDDAPISYASAVTAHTLKDDELSRARRTGISKLRNYLAQFGTSTISQLFDLLESRGTVAERQAIGKTRESLRATLAGLIKIFAVSDQIVDLIVQAPRVSGLAKVSRFLQTKGSCGMVQIAGFMGQQGTREEREALGENPQNLGATLLKFPNLFVFDGECISLKCVRQPKVAEHNMAAGFGGITSSILPAFLTKNRTRNESIGVDSGYEGSVTFDQSDREGASDKAIRRSSSGSSLFIHSSNSSVDAKVDALPSFTMIDIANNNDNGLKEFKQECLDNNNEFNKPIIGISMPNDGKWMAISCCSDKVYLVDLETCSADGPGDYSGGVCYVLKSVFQSSKIVKIVFDCRMVAAALQNRFGFNLTNVFDIMRAHELLTCDDTTSVDELCSKYEGVTPPNKWSATIRGLPGWKVLDSGGSTSDIELAANARVLVPHLYRRMVVRFTEARLNEVLRLCEQMVQTRYF